MIFQERILQELNQIRKERQMSIADMIDGITSERSYRRYQNNELTVPLDVLFQLLHRVQITIPDLFLHNNPRELFELQLEHLYIRHQYLDESIVAELYQTLDAHDITSELRSLFARFEQSYKDCATGKDCRELVIETLQKPVMYGLIVTKNLLVLSYAIESYIEGDCMMSVTDIYLVLIEASKQITRNKLFYIIVTRFLNYVLHNDTWIPSLHEELVDHIKEGAFAQDSMALTGDINLHSGAPKDPSYQDKTLNQSVYQAAMILMLKKDSKRFREMATVAKERYHNDLLEFIRFRAKEEKHHISMNIQSRK